MITVANITQTLRKRVRLARDLTTRLLSRSGDNNVALDDAVREQLLELLNANTSLRGSERWLLTDARGYLCLHLRRTD